MGAVSGATGVWTTVGRVQGAGGLTRVVTGDVGMCNYFNVWVGHILVTTAWG